MTARPPRRDGGNDDGGGRVVSGKALLIAVVGVVLGVLALNAGQHPSPSAGSTTTTTTTSTTLGTTTTTKGSAATTTTAGAATAAPSASVKVLVANASSTNGVAGYYKGVIQGAGWGVLTAATATTEVQTSVVYYTTGQQAAANGVAKTLGLTASSVQAVSASMPVGKHTGANVVVVIGDDLAAKAPTSG